MINFIKKLLGLSDAVAIDPNGPNNITLAGHPFKAAYQQAPNKAVLLDVRTPGEFSSGSIKGALNIDIMSSNFAQKVEKLDKDATYFIFCRSGNRSGQACKMMHKMGFDVRNLAGGIGSYPR